MNLCHVPSLESSPHSDQTNVHMGAIQQALEEMTVSGEEYQEISRLDPNDSLKTVLPFIRPVYKSGQNANQRSGRPVQVPLKTKRRNHGAFHKPVDKAFTLLPAKLPGYTSPLVQLTINIGHVFSRINHNYTYDSKCNPRRVLTKPCTPANNDGFDNVNSDYILYVNGVLGDHNNMYTVVDMLGAGTFGQVVKARHNITHRLYGIKVIKNKPAYRKQSQVEIKILKHLNQFYDPDDKHHILRLYETFVHQNHLCLVFELLSVNLYELIRQNHFKGLSANLVSVFSRQIADALVVLADAGIIHCDLKPENILLKSLDSPQIKVVDFGSACHQSQTMYTYIQSRFYRSPEVLLGLTYTRAIDMWSFGCIVAELFLGLPLFPGSSEYNQIERITDTLGSPPPYMVEQGKNGLLYFNQERIQGRVQYTIKGREQFQAEQARTEKPNKQYFNTTDLVRLVLDHGMPRKNMSQAEKAQEMEERELLLAFLHKVLQIDPMRRMTPYEARYHAFLKSTSSPRQLPVTSRGRVNSLYTMGHSNNNKHSHAALFKDPLFKKPKHAEYAQPELPLYHTTHNKAHSLVANVNTPPPSPVNTNPCTTGYGSSTAMRSKLGAVQSDQRPHCQLRHRSCPESKRPPNSSLENFQLQ